jgi:hypothetical protein
MAHMTSISAGMFSDLAICTDATTNAAAIASPTMTNLQAAFGATSDFVRIKDVREFPSMGTPPNVVNVPVYGSTTSQQIQGQADAPSMELTINYVGDDWKAGSDLGDMVGDGKQYVFRFTLMNEKPDSYTCDATGLGTVANSQYYWIGKVEALQVTPQLTDANTATVTITIQSEFYGAYTTDPS